MEDVKEKEGLQVGLMDLIVSNVLRLYFSCEIRNRNFSANTKRNAILERD